MKHEFVSYQIALDMKSIGFDEPCFGYYENDVFILCYDSKQKKELLLNCSAPTFSSAFRWFRDTHNMLANVYSNASGFLFEYHDTIGGTHRYDSEFSGPNDGGCWDTYEEAELACLIKLIEIIKTK